MTTVTADKWVVGYRTQREWAWLISIAFFLGGIGAGLFILSTFLDFIVGAVVGLLVVAVGKGTAHLLYLGHPERAWRALMRPQTSWISRGLILVVVFVVFGTLSLVAGDSAVGDVFAGVAVAAALGVAVYSGFVLAYSPAISFWNTALLPLLFLLYSFLGGIALTFVLYPWHNQAVAGAREVLETAEVGLVLTALLFVVVYLATMFYGALPSRQAVRNLVRGRLATLFLLGVVGVGLLMPLAVALAVRFGGVEAATGAWLLVGSGLLELCGGLLFRYCLLRGGVFFPLI
ncbi:MAG: polysulfide reductase NrfD [Chloroflexi bacterium]|nr:polysulfide reductase NrfD [Chloroflexota bacterium]